MTNNEWKNDEFTKEWKLNSHTIHILCQTLNVQKTMENTKTETISEESDGGRKGMGEGERTKQKRYQQKDKRAQKIQIF